MAINSVNDSSYAFLNTRAASNAEDEETGQLALNDFLSLMTTQLQNQDPLKPMESGDFLGQIASFATVTGISDLNDSFDGFSNSMQSNQALQGSSLVGRSVLVPSSIGEMTAGNGLSGQIDVVEPVTDLSIKIYNETGALVRTLEMGNAYGETPFTWDGFDDNGEALSEGIYQFRATGTVDDANTAFSTSVAAQVSSVLVNESNGLVVNLAGVGSVPFDEVKEIL